MSRFLPEQIASQVSELFYQCCMVRMQETVAQADRKHKPTKAVDMTSPEIG